MLTSFAAGFGDHALPLSASCASFLAPVLPTAAFPLFVVMLDCSRTSRTSWTLDTMPDWMAGINFCSLKAGI